MKRNTAMACILTAGISTALVTGVAFLFAKDMTRLKPMPVSPELTQEEAHYNYSFSEVDHGGSMKAYTGFYFGDDDGIVLHGLHSNVFVNLSGYEQFAYLPDENKVTFLDNGLNYVCTMTTLEPAVNNGEVVVWQDEGVSKYCIPTVLNEDGDGFLVATETKGEPTEAEFQQIQNTLANITKQISLCTDGAETISIAGVSIPLSSISSITPEYVVLDEGGRESYLEVSPLEADEQENLEKVYDQFVGGELSVRYTDSVTDTQSGYTPYVFWNDGVRFTLYCNAIEVATSIANEMHFV